MLDYDKDGWLDIYMVNGSTYEAMAGKAPAPHAALFHNNHDGTFTEVAEKAGVANDRWGFGVAVGDYDNDGWPDIFVANFGKNRLYHNNHDGTFTDMAEKAGVQLGNWSSGPTFGDYDGDGKLDLFVSGYVHYEDDKPPTTDSKAVAANFCQFRGVNVMCGPRGLKGEHDHLFHNNGNGTFTDVSEKLGVNDPNGYYGFTSIFVDLNNDGKVDLLVADDSTPNYLYINNGKGTFEDDSYASGYALNENGRETASMGVAIGDYQNTGRSACSTPPFPTTTTCSTATMAMPTLPTTAMLPGSPSRRCPSSGWATEFIDYDNDGWKDLFAANGHVYPEVDKNNWGTTYAQRPLLFRNELGKKFTLVPPVEGTGLAVVIPPAARPLAISLTTAASMW